MLEQYYTINEATGIAITIRQDGNITVNACSVTINHSQLTIVRKIISTANVEALGRQLTPKSVVALNLSGKGILQKQVEKTPEINQHNFSKVLPNANFEDFYIQHFISGDRSFVSVVRKTEADRWINQLKMQGLIPLSLSLGPFPVENIISQLNIYDNDFTFDGCAVTRNEQREWLTCQYDESARSPFSLKVELESLDEKLVIPYAAAFQLVMADKLEPIEAEAPSLQAAFQSLTGEKKLKAQGGIILCVLFALLLINFLLFSWLNSANAKLTEKASHMAQSTVDIQNMNDQVQKKETLLSVLGWEGNINKSSIIDQIAALLPQEITWNAVEVDPVDLSGGRTNKFVAFFNRRIRIAGNSQKIIPVNEWIARIKTKPWVKNVQMDSYTFNNELNTGQFIILIDY